MQLTAGRAAVIAGLGTMLAFSPAAMAQRGRVSTGLTVTARVTAGPYVATIRTCDRPRSGNAEIRMRIRRTGRTIRRTTTDGRPLCHTRGRTRARHLVVTRGGAIAWSAGRCRPDYPTACESEVLWRWTGRSPVAVDTAPGELSGLRRRNGLYWYVRDGTVELLAMPEHSRRSRGPTCRSGRTLAQRGDVRVFQVGARVYGCLRPSRGVVSLGESFGGSPGGSASVHSLAIAGTYVAFAQDEDHYELHTTELRVVDLRTGRVSRSWAIDDSLLGHAGGSISDVLLTRYGGVVWVAQLDIAPCETACSPLLWAWINEDAIVLDASDGPLTGIRLDGSAVVWARSGVPRSALMTLTCDPLDWRCGS
jgi:hypothetical protein